MSSIGNKEIFAANLRSYMEQNAKDRNDICRDLNIKYTTFTDWYNGNKYPRIDKIELLASYFHIMKSDLIEDKADIRDKKNSALLQDDRINAIINDPDIQELLSRMDHMSKEQIQALLNTARAFSVPQKEDDPHQSALKERK